MRVERRSFLASLWSGLSVVIWGREAPAPEKWPSDFDLHCDNWTITPAHDPIGDVTYASGIIRARVGMDVEIGDALCWDHAGGCLVKLNATPEPGHCVAMQSAKKNESTTATIVGPNFNT